MSKILVTGGTGNLGKSLEKVLQAHNVAYTIASRHNKHQKAEIAVMDLLSGKGVKEAVAGKQIIFHLATDLKRDTNVTLNLLREIHPNDNVHLIYMSIVGIDKVPFPYYKQKLASEEAIKKSGIPYTILRATQFHEFIDQLLSTFLKFPIGILPKKVIAQPIQTEIVAEKLYQLSLKNPTNKTHEIGGVDSYTFKELAKQWLAHQNKKRWIINLPIFGALGKAFRNGSLTTDDKQYDSSSWGQWLDLNR